MTDKNHQLLNLRISHFGSENEGRLAILIEGMTTKEQLDFIMEQLNRFMSDNAKQIRQ